MKKLMVLALVLSVVGLANAGLAIKAADLKTAEITGEGNTGALACYVFTKGGQVNDGVMLYGGDLADKGVAPADALAALIEAYGPITQAFALNFADAPDTNGNVILPNGPLAKFDAIQGPVEVFLADADGAVLGSVVLIPEPITMGLLALGGLFIRRKK